MGLGRDRGFLYRDRTFWLCVAIWFSVSQHDSQATGRWLVVTGVFLVAIELFSFVFSIATGAFTLPRQCFVF